ncbi:MAG: hypothetical protein AB8B50_12880 [Pirellulaceae bacterium]
MRRKGRSSSRQSSSKVARCLFVASTVLLAPLVAIACDYTVRDIGFVAFDESDFSLIVTGPKDLELDATAMRRIKDLGVQLERRARPDLSAWDIQILDREGSHLQLARTAANDSLPNIVDLLNDKLQTPRMQEIQEGVLGTFAQIVFFSGEDIRGLEIARKAAKAVRDLEPMLPRPVSLPVRLLEIDVEERSRERVLMWAAGLDALPAEESAMVVLYGRGRLAGPAMAGDEIQLDEALRQLALVGESCECDTSRDWTKLRRLPLLWTTESSENASRMLGFDISDPSVLAEVKDVLSRGRRGDETGWPDRLARIVEGYFEGSIAGSTPELIPIPPGRDSRRSATLQATVIEGDGWDFEDDDSVAETSLVDSTSKEVKVGGQSQVGSQINALVKSEAAEVASAATSKSSRWPWAIGGIALLFTAGFLFFRSKSIRNE